MKRQKSDTLCSAAQQYHLQQIEVVIFYIKVKRINKACWVLSPSRHKPTNSGAGASTLKNERGNRLAHREVWRKVAGAGHANTRNIERTVILHISNNQKAFSGWFRK